MDILHKLNTPVGWFILTAYYIVLFHLSFFIVYFNIDKIIMNNYAGYFSAPLLIGPERIIFKLTVLRLNEYNTFEHINNKWLRNEAIEIYDF